MRWLKRNLWKIGLIIVVGGPVLAWMVWISLSVAGGQSGHNPAIQTGRAQATPTVNTTALAVDVLTQQDDKLQRDNSFPWTLLNAIGGAGIGGIGTIFLAVAAFVTARNGLKQWQGNREDEQKKRDKEQERWQKEQEAERRKQDEERFQIVVTQLGSEREEAKVGAAITLRTFLHEGYEQFYTQVFDLAVAHFRFPRVSGQPTTEVITPQDLTTLSHAVIMVFKEAFPLARDLEPKSPQSLDARGIQLDNAYLRNADLKRAWMPHAYLRNADLSEADLREANLDHANLTGANLSGADLREASVNGIKLWRAKLYRTNLSGLDLTNATLHKTELVETNLDMATLVSANLNGAILQGAKCNGANLSGVSLCEAILYQAELREANLSGSVLSAAQLMMADLTKADLHLTVLDEVNLAMADLSEVKNLSGVRSMKGTILRGVKGLTKEELEMCKGKGAIVDEDPPASLSESTITVSPPVQSTDTQTQPDLSTQGNTPPHATNGSSAASSSQQAQQS